MLAKVMRAEPASNDFKNFAGTFVQKLRDKFITLIMRLDKPTRGGRIMGQSVTATNTLYFSTGTFPYHYVYAYDPKTNSVLPPIQLDCLKYFRLAYTNIRLV